MTMTLRFAIAAVGLACALGGTASAADGAAEAQRARGERIYREGILPSGGPLAGVAQAGVVRTGRDAACLACHRRSGFGTSEGTYVIRPITGRDLYQAPEAKSADARVDYWRGKRLRPAYDDATLARAIRQGVDVNGRRMQEVMPRYALAEDDMAALQAYLKTLFAQDAAGVTPSEIHLATVIQPDVPTARRRVMLDVLQSFIQEKNAGVRSEETRRKAGTMRMFRAYRKWVLHVWDLAGPSETWHAQLQEKYRAQPVFALVAGLGSGNWQPIHAFSEQFDLPCVLPLTDLPGAGGHDFYTVYFSRGIALEAAALAQFLDKRSAEGRIIQAFRREGAGAAAAQALRAALGGSAARLQDRPLTGDADAAFWRELAGAQASAVVLWLGQGDLPGAAALADLPQQPAVYLSSTLLAGATPPAGLQALLTYPWALPSARASGVQRSVLWLRTHGVEFASDELQAIGVNTLFAATVTGEALMHLQDSFSRDYFVERVEHAVTTSITPTFFPHVSLGPGTRFASKGAYIVRPEATHAGAGVTAVSDWIVP